MLRLAVICLGAFAGVLSGGLARSEPSSDEPEQLRPVVVTGSYVTDSGEAFVVPATVIERDEWELSGWVGISELVGSVSSVSGVDGRSNQFSSNGLAGSANINLRGLGPSRTLVLVNGRRMAPSPFAIDDQAQMFVDLNHLPVAMMERVEVLREGAGSIYGSDAVAGVVQFVSSRQELRGVWFEGQYRSVAPGRSESRVSVVAGGRSGSLRFAGSVGYSRRERVPLTDRQWAVRPFEANRLGGWSGIGNPGGFAARSEDGSLTGPVVADAGCVELGGVVSVSGGCRFQYTRFVNLVEEEHRWQGFGEARLDVGRVRFRIEGLWGHTDIPRWQTSPSTPPQLWTEHVIGADHPALVRWRGDNPVLASRVYGAGDPAETELVFLGRPLGASGNPLTASGASEGYRRRTSWRFGGEMTVDVAEGHSVVIAGFVSRAFGERASADTYRAGFANALRGYGVCSDPVSGDIPVAARAGEGECVYFNPFSSAIEVSRVNGVENEGYVRALANSRDLIDWLRDSVRVEAVNDLVTLDALYTGSVSRFVWALGVQARLEGRRLTPDALNDLSRTPGPDGTGVFSFLAATGRVSVGRAVTAVFAEAGYDASSNISINGALRYENYGGVSALDPAVSVVWKESGLAFRASVRGLVRSPGLNQIGGVSTSLQYVAPTGAFRAVDRHGNPELRPETGLQAAVDAVYTGGNLSLSARIWAIGLRDTIIVYDRSQIVSVAVAALERGDLTADIVSRLTFQSGLEPSPSTIARVRTDLANGPELGVSGVDVGGFLVWAAAGGSWRLTGSASYVGQFSVGSYGIDGNEVAATEVVGQFNITNAFRPLPRLKARSSLAYASGRHRAQLSVSYIGEYYDERSEVPIDAVTVFDVGYRYGLSGQMSIGVAIGNIFDIAPPGVGFDLNYDPYTHSPLGRTVTIGVSAGL